MNELTLKMIATVQYMMSITRVPHDSPMLLQSYSRWLARMERIEHYLICREGRS